MYIEFIYVLLKFHMFIFHLYIYSYLKIIGFYKLLMVVKINILWYQKIKEDVNTDSWFDIFKSDNPNIKLTFTPLLERIDKKIMLKNNRIINERKYKKSIKRKHNKIKDLQLKTSNYLCKQYNTICIKKLNTKSILDNKKSNIFKLTKRLIYTLSHYRFRMILESQCDKFNCTLKVIDEYNTSKCCNRCKEINDVGFS